MKLEKDLHVKCILKNNALLEGIIKVWSDEEIILESLDRKSIMIVHGGTSDIVLTKVILEEDNTSELSTENIQSAISEKIKNVLEIPAEETELKDKSVKELVDLRNEQERRIIREKLKDHSATEIRTVQYGTPRFFKK